MNRVGAFFAIFGIATPALCATDADFLRLVERNDKAQNLVDQGAALVTAGARAFTIWDTLRLCEHREVNSRMLEEGDWRANATLTTCCATLVDGGGATTIVQALSPFIDYTSPRMRVGKVFQSRMDAATYIADQLIGLSLEEKKDFIAEATSPAFDAAINICRAAVN